MWGVRRPISVSTYNPGWRNRCLLPFETEESPFIISICGREMVSISTGISPTTPLWLGYRATEYRTLLCCNVLEHVVGPAAICTQLERLIPSGGHIVVTVPNRFPYHPDPIDTMFRPDAQQVAALFPGCDLLQGAIVECGTGWDYVNRSPRALVAKVKRRLSRLQENGGMGGTTSFLPWLFRHFFQTCALLQRHQTRDAS